MMVVAEEMQEHEEEEYEAERAKVAAGLAWLAAKARSPESTCEDLRAPFYRDEYNQEHLKGNVGELLASGELYCHVFQQQLHGKCSPAVPRQGHWAVIQGLARRGLYVMEEEDCPVTEADLQNIPIRMSCHLAMLDSLMLACAVEQMSIEKVVTSVRRFSVVSPRELPFDLDGAMLLWINKVNMKLKDSVEKEQKQQSVAEGACQQKSPAKWYWKLVPPDLMLAVSLCLKEPEENARVVRYRKDQSVSRQLPVIPVLRSLSEISDGRALLSLIHYYCPELLRLEDVCLKERLSPTERMYNIRLLIDVSQQHFEGCLLLTPSDLLRCPPALKTNIMAFVAELFWCFEVVRPEFVCPREPLEHSTDGERFTSETARHVLRIAYILISINAREDDGGREASRDDLETSEMRIGDFLLRKSASGLHNLANGMLGAEGEQSEDDGKMKEHGSSVPFRRKASSQLPDKSVTFAPVTSADVRNMSPAEDGFDVQSLPVLRRVNSPAKAAAAHPQGKAGGGFYLHSTDAWSQPDANRASFVLNSHYDTPEKALAAGLPVVEPVNGEKGSIVEVDSDVDDSGKPQSSDNTDVKGAQSEFLSSPVPSPSPSPCPSVESNTSSSSGVKMTSFAERKFRKFNSAETKSSPGSPPNHPLASEVVRLQMKLEEKRRAIEAQRRQVEALCAKQRQKFGKEAFMHVIKGGKKDRLDPQGIGGDSSESSGEQMLPARTQLEAPVDNSGEYSRSIYKLNDTLRGLQSEMLRMAQQQEHLLQMRDSQQAMAEAEAKLPQKNYDTYSLSPASSGSPANRTPTRRHLSKSPARVQLRSPRNNSTPRPNELRFSVVGPPQESPQPSLARVLSPQPYVDNLRHRRRYAPNEVRMQTSSTICFGDDETEVSSPTMSKAESDMGLIEVDLSGMNTPEGLLSEDDAAENAADYSTDGEQKAALGFFFKGDQGPTEEERERKKAAFLQKQQKKAEEARLKKLQMEAEVEKKREEERRKAEEDEAKKAEKKADREYVREVFRRRHQDQQWEQHQARTKATKGAKAKIRKPRPKSAHREEGGSASLSPFKPAVGGALNRFHSASSLSLVSTTNSEPEGGRSRRPNRSGSMELLDADGAGSGESPTADKDWDNASQVSSHVSGGEYTGPKLYKEPSAKSNKHIIHNALSYCCLAGKVNELQKQKVIEELERCDANHYMILFRDAGCQYRALYAFFPETEEIQRVTGFGPKAVSAKMLDRLYKYSSDRKQFTSIPAKTISVSMDAFTIQNHLWQPRRPSSTIIPTTPTYSSSTATASKKPGPGKP
ncbi:unnamed protein product [Lampetra planeri]